MREFIILGVILLAAWSIIPSIQVHSKSGEAKKEFIKQNPKVAAKAMNFGLDLAGGTSITLQIDSKGLKTEDIKDIQQQSLEIVRNRVDQFGLSEPQISPSGNDRINVELAGVDDSTAKTLVGSTAKLEFKILAEQEKFSQIVMLIDNYLLGRSDKRIRRRLNPSQRRKKTPFPMRNFSQATQSLMILLKRIRLQQPVRIPSNPRQRERLFPLFTFLSATAGLSPRNKSKRLNAF